MYILGIETTGPVGSAAFMDLDGSSTVVMKKTAEAMSHLRLLTEMIRGLMTENLIGPEDISAIACSAGPGSFTGIRIGVTTARTIAQVWDKPCISVSSLEVFAQRCGEENDVAAIFNARRGQVYGALFSAGSGVMLKPGPYMLGDVIEAAESAEAAKSPVRVRWYGDGTDAYASDLEGFDIAPREERYQTADMVCAEGAKALRAGRTVRYTELMPDYMRQSEAEQKLRDGTLKRLREEKMKRFR